MYVVESYGFGQKKGVEGEGLQPTKLPTYLADMQNSYMVEK